MPRALISRLGLEDSYCDPQKRDRPGFLWALHHDPLAQSAEHLPFKQGVRGSNPRRVTRMRRYEPSLW